MAHSNPVNLPASGKYVRLYVDWTAASTRANILTGSKSGDVDGEALATSMGKIAKWYTDFKTLVFTDLSISNGTAETGKAITALSYNTSTGAISVTKGTFLTQHPTISTDTDTTSTATPAHGGTFTAIDSVTRDTNGHVKKVNTKTVTLPAQYVHPTYTAYTGKPTENQTPAFGATFTISQVKSDATGHVTSMTDRTVKIPALTYTATVTSSTADAYQIGTLNIGGTDNVIYGKNTVYIHPTYTRNDTTSTASNLEFNVIDSVTTNNGHVTAVNVKTVSLSDNDTKNTAGSTDTSSKIFLVGATSQTTYAQTYSDDQCYVTNGAFQARVVSASGGVNANTANSQTAGGLSLYGTDPSTYGIMFRSTSSRGKHGYVQSDWATYFTMNNSATRGWVFYSQANVASVSGAGNAVFNGSVTVGGNTTNTSGCRMTYNSTTESLDFVFAS